MDRLVRGGSSPLGRISILGSARLCKRRANATVQGVSGLTFNVVYEDAGDGWVYAHVPELPEVHTQGEDLQQTRVAVRDAIELVLDERRVRGESIPAPGWALVEPVEIAARRSASSNDTSLSMAAYWPVKEPITSYGKRGHRPANNGSAPPGYQAADCTRHLQTTRRRSAAVPLEA